MQTPEEAREKFNELKSQVMEALDTSGVRISEDVRESVEFTRTYTQLIAGIEAVMFDVGIRTSPDLIRKFRQYKTTAGDRRQSLEAEGLGVDLTTVG